MKGDKKLLWAPISVVVVGVIMIVGSSVLMNSVDDSLNNKPDKIKEETPVQIVEEKKDLVSSIKMRIGDKVFLIDVDSGDVAQQFAKSVPLTLEMNELNGNEKYYRGNDKYDDSNASAPGYIELGDLMLYGDDTVVLFYDNFESEYEYTRIGWVNDKSGLVDALGEGNVKIDFIKDEGGK